MNPAINAYVWNGTVPAAFHPGIQPTIARVFLESRQIASLVAKHGGDEKAQAWWAKQHVKRMRRRFGLNDKYVPLTKQY